MRLIACKTGSRTKLLVLSMVCGMALAAPAHAQFGGFGGFGGFSAGQQQQLGTTLTVPVSALGTVYAQNIIRQKNVNFLALTQAAFGNFNVQVATVSITQRNTAAPAKEVVLPKWAVPIVKQINKNHVIIEQQAHGNGNVQVATVEVHQANYAKVPAGAHYFYCPLWAAGPILQLNNNVAIVTQIAIGDGNQQVALVAVDQKNAAKTKVPAGAANSIAQINNNVTIVTQVAVGDGNVQAAVVDVKQQNRFFGG